MIFDGVSSKTHVKKASRKIWLLRRMRNLGVDENTIAAYWKTEGVCHLEYCSPVYSSALTKQQQQDLARNKNYI